jgi:hypothetical protein
VCGLRAPPPTPAAAASHRPRRPAPPLRARAPRARARAAASARRVQRGRVAAGGTHSGRTAPPTRPGGGAGWGLQQCARNRIRRRHCGAWTQGAAAPPASTATAAATSAASPHTCSCSRRARASRSRKASGLSPSNTRLRRDTHLGRPPAAQSMRQRLRALGVGRRRGARVRGQSGERPSCRAPRPDRQCREPPHPSSNPSSASLLTRRAQPRRRAPTQTRPAGQSTESARPAPLRPPCAPRQGAPLA